jgi:Holliday junction resolvase
MKQKSLVIALLILVLLSACGPAATDAPVKPAATDVSSATEAATATSTATAVPATAAPTPIPVADELAVDPNFDLGTISPYLYGTNYGPMHAVPLEVLPLVEQAGFTALRFPAGAWTDAVDVKPFQIDMLMTFAKQLGAMPTISVRLLGGKPETAAELVRYTNIEKKYGVTYGALVMKRHQTNETSDYDYTIDHLKEWRDCRCYERGGPNHQIDGS